MLKPVAVSATLAAEFTALNAYYAAQGEAPIHVGLWTTDPNLMGDDCSEGQSVANLGDAIAILTEESIAGRFPFAAVHGEGIEPKVFQLQTDAQIKASAARREHEMAADREAARWESAMLAGMAGGCDAFNDAMGY